MNYKAAVEFLKRSKTALKYDANSGKHGLIFAKETVTKKSKNDKPWVDEEQQLLIRDEEVYFKMIKEAGFELVGDYQR